MFYVYPTVTLSKKYQFTDKTAVGAHFFQNAYLIYV